MSYLLESLSDGERIKGEFQLHWMMWLPCAGAMTVGVAAAAMILLIGSQWSGGAFDLLTPAILALLFFFFVAVFMHLKLRTIEQGVTNKRVVRKSGLIARNTQEINLKALETVEIKQPILGRILNFGNIEVTGRGAAVIRFIGVKSPMDVKLSIENEGGKALNGMQGE